MSKPRFDNGPWRTHLVDETLICGNDDGRVVEVAQALDDYETDKGVERITANAHLIAAAPDMYEALLQCREYLKHSLGSTSEVNPYPALDAALAKARGEK